MSELIRAMDAAAGAKYRDRTARTDAAVEAALTNLAGLFLRYGQSLLDGDDLHFPRLAKQRRQWGQDLELRSKAQRLLEQANSAFAAKDYDLAARLLSEIEPLLTEAQSAKLRIARERGTMRPS